MRFRLSFLFFCVASTAMAEERFYQVIDASGRVQLIRDSVGAEKKERTKSDVAPKIVTPPDAKRDIPAVSAGRPESAPYAAYEGDEYVDSESMDESHQSSQKQRFVILNDGVGQRIENMNGTNEAFSSPEASSVADEYIVLKNAYMQLPIASAKDLNGGCLSEKQVKEARSLSVGRMSDVVFDKRLANYTTEGQLVQAYRINGAGAKTVSLRSYSRTDMEPSFIVPFVAFANAKGCIDRVASSYFQRFYPETKSRHPLLEASLLMHSEDAYLLLIMPAGMVDAGKDRPEYRISSVGRVSIKWQP